VDAFGAPGSVPAAAAATYLWRALVEMDERWPHVSLRDSVGWALTHQALWVPDAGDQGAWMLPFADVGLVEVGWLFAAAGFSPEEAVGHVKAGRVDEDALATLAVLRGVAVPATT
jgi:hypothetical protein